MTRSQGILFVVAVAIQMLGHYSPYFVITSVVSLLILAVWMWRSPLRRKEE